MAKRWLRFSDSSLQARLVQMAHALGTTCSTDELQRVWFDDDEWWRYRDPHLLALDERFGPDWVAVYANNAEQRQLRIERLETTGIPFVVWFDEFGTYLVLAKVYCPPDWEYS